MMALWMAYAVAVSLLLAGAALAAEQGLDLYRRPTRWPWVAALVGSVAVPAAAYAAAAGWLSGGAAAEALAGGGGAGAGGAVPPLLLSAAEASAGGAAGWLDGARSLDPWLAGGCAAASLAVAGWLTLGWLRLRSSRRRWRSEEIGGVRVLVSPDEGPAVTGLLRGTILLPAWFEELDRDLRRLVLRHEREHLSSGDHRTWAMGLATVVLMPWNPVVWWALSRLRQAMEIDCDRRVLARGVSRAAYGELLVQAGRRAVGSPLSPASLAATPSQLERRIRRLAGHPPEARTSRAAMAVTAVVVLGLAGGRLPAPEETVTMAAEREAPAEARAPQGSTGQAEAAARGTVVPPVPAVMRFDLRLYRTRDAGDEAERERSRELDIEAVRLARRLTYGCAPYLDTRGDASGGEPASPGGPGCLVVMDGRRVAPRTLFELGPGVIQRIDILPSEEATDRFGADGRDGAFVVRTERG